MSDADAVLDRTRSRAARGRDRARRAGVRPRRRRDRQDPCHHPPHRLRRATAGSTSPSRCWPSPSPPGPRARCAPGCARSASAASRPAPSTPPRCASCSYFWPQVVGGAPPAICEHKAGLVADAAARLRLTVDRAAVRDLAAEIEWAKVTLLTPETYAAAAGRAGRGEPGGFDVPTICSAARGLRGRQDGPQRHRLRGRPAPHRRHPGANTPMSRRRSAASTGTSSSTSTRTSPPSSSRLLDLWLGDRDDVCVVGDPSPDHLLVHRGLARATSSDFPRRRPGARVVRLVRDYRSTPQIVHLANSLLRRADGAFGTGRRAPPGPASNSSPNAPPVPCRP